MKKLLLACAILTITNLAEARLPHRFKFEGTTSEKGCEPTKKFFVPIEGFMGGRNCLVSDVRLQKTVMLTQDCLIAARRRLLELTISAKNKNVHPAHLRIVTYRRGNPSEPELICTYRGYLKHSK